MMREQSRRYKRFEKARQRIAEARAEARRREEERRINPPLFDLSEIGEVDR